MRSFNNSNNIIKDIPNINNSDSINFRAFLRSRRAQFTVFVIMGIVLIFAFGFLMYSKGELQNSLQLGQTSKVINQFVTDTKMKAYTQSCLDRIFEEVIKEVGETGGGLSGAVAVGIGTSDSPDKGKNTLPKLCSSTGANRMGDPNNLNEFAFYSCSYGTYGLAGSVQESMEDAIKQAFEHCVVSSEFVRNDPNIEIIPKNEDAAVTVVFGEDGLNVNVSYPFALQVNNGEPVIEYFNYHSHSDARLMKVYDLAFHMIYDEIEKPEFHLADPALSYQDTRCSRAGDNDYKCLYPGMGVAVGTPDSSGDYVVSVTDDRSTVSGSPFQFKFKIENRRPYLAADDECSAFPNPNAVDFLGSKSFYIYLIDHDDPPLSSLSFDADADLALNSGYPQMNANPLYPDYCIFFFGMNSGGDLYPVQVSDGFVSADFELDWS